MFLSGLLAAGGLLFAFEHATIAGKLVLLLLAIVSIFSWSVMVTKLRVIQFARKQNARFLFAFRQDRQPLRLFEKKRALSRLADFQCLPRWLSGDYVSAARLRRSGRNIQSATWHRRQDFSCANGRGHGAVGETALELESQMILLATAVSGSPFLGLLGTVWGVMDAFTGVAEAGAPNLAAMAPGVSGALITTVTALCVAIPAMFGYNFLVTSIRGIIVEMDNFAAELASEFEHKYVDHSVREPEFRR